MFGREEDIFPDETKQSSKQYKIEQKEQKAAKKQKKQEEKELKKQEKQEQKCENTETAFAEAVTPPSGELNIPKMDKEEELPRELDRVVTVSDLPETLDSRKGVTVFQVFLGILLGIMIVGSGFLAAFLAGYFNGEPFSLLGQWQLIVSTDIFFVSTLGFFSTEGRTEKIYGVFSILSAVCFVVELIITFS